MSYYDDQQPDDYGFYDEFGNPLTPSEMDGYMEYGDPQFETDYNQGTASYEQPQNGYSYQQPQQQDDYYYQQPQQQPESEPEYYYTEPQYQQPQEDYYLTDEIGNKEHIRGGKNFRDYMNRKYN